jgi:glycosyltransferase involved in cell wall biosynthesis
MAYAPETSPVTRIPTQGRRYSVLMLAPTSFFADYGCHVRILEEARILRQLGQRVTIATYHNGGPVPDLDIRRTLSIPWRRDYEVGSSRHKLVFDALLGWEAYWLLVRERYDVIHAHLHEGALIGQILMRLFGLPMVFDFQGGLTGEMLDHHFIRQDSAAYRALLRLETWLDRSSPMIVTSSAQAAQLLQDNFGCRSEQVQVLPDCVNADVFRPAASYDPSELPALRQRLNIPLDRRLIVYLGLLAEYQGTGLLLEALQRLVQERRDVHLLLMGFPNVEFYRAKAQILGIDDFVTFTGRVPYDEAPKHLALGDVAVAPKLSLTEGAGKLLNYMAVGLPTVAFDTPVARQYLGVDGLFAARGDVASLTDELRVALFPSPDSGRRYARIGEQLRQRATQHFGWEPAGHQIVEIYRKLLGETTGKAASAPKWAVSGK